MLLIMDNGNEKMLNITKPNFLAVFRDEGPSRTRIGNIEREIERDIFTKKFVFMLECKG